MQARGYKQDSNGDLFVPKDGKNGQNGGATAAATKNNGAAAMNPTVAAPPIIAIALPLTLRTRPHVKGSATSWMPTRKFCPPKV